MARILSSVATGVQKGVLEIPFWGFVFGKSKCGHESYQLGQLVMDFDYGLRLRFELRLSFYRRLGSRRESRIEPVFHSLRASSS